MQSRFYGKVVRPIRIVGGFAYVPLTQGYEAVIDAVDVPLVEKLNWVARVGRLTVYAGRIDCSGGGRRLVLMHRLIIGSCLDAQVDHRDRDGLNNRRSNLREANTSENARNKRVRSDSSSGLKGVKNCHGRWRACITFDGRRVHLGYYSTAQAAHAAYVDASKNLYGEFARAS